MNTNNTHDFETLLRQKCHREMNSADLKFRIQTDLNFAMRQNPLVKVILNQNDDWFEDFNTDKWANHMTLGKLPLYYCFLQALTLGKSKYFNKVLAKTRDINAADKDGATIMHHVCAWAAMFNFAYKNKQAFQYLKAKACVRRFAARLIAAGGDALRVDKENLCALDYAIVSQDTGLIRLFYNAVFFEKVMDKKTGTLRLIYQKGKGRSRA